MRNVEQVIRSWVAERGAALTDAEMEDLAGRIEEDLQKNELHVVAIRLAGADDDYLRHVRVRRAVDVDEEERQWRLYRERMPRGPAGKRSGESRPPGAPVEERPQEFIDWLKGRGAQDAADVKVVDLR
jgi:hypothetical protein